MKIPLPDIRRVVTGHDENGVANIRSNRNMVSEDMTIVPGGRSSGIWVTNDGLPTKDNNNLEDGATRLLADDENRGLVHPNGSNLRSTELAPGAITPMHRTSSLDYNILVQGELVLIMEDGSETKLNNPGDTIIMKGGMHAWRNPSQTWTRWITVLLAAEPAVVNGEQSTPLFLPIPSSRNGPMARL